MANITTATWSVGELEGLAGLISVRVGAWNHFGCASPQGGQAAIPPLGERSAEAIKAGHGAVEAIDDLIRHLHDLRAVLITELRTDSDAHLKRVDVMLAERNGPRS